MHKFNLEIELENKDYCNGCPLLSMSYHSCMLYDTFIEQIVQVGHKDFGGYTRPEICKQNDKEKTK